MKQLLFVIIFIVLAITTFNACTQPTAGPTPFPSQTTAPTLVATPGPSAAPAETAVPTPPLSTTTAPVPASSPTPPPSTTTAPVPAYTSTPPPSTTTAPSPASTTIPPQQPDFDSITVTEIKSTLLSSSPINASNSNANLLPAGTAVLYRTNEGRCGKLAILENGEYLRFKWITYNVDGTIRNQGNNQSVKLTQYYDLDFGTIDENSSDFLFLKVNEIERYLTPTDNAQFMIYNLNSKVAPPAVLSEAKQDIEYILKRGVITGYYVSFERYLKAGDNITGFFQVNGDAGDFTKTTWYFQILDPDENIERSWMGCGDTLICTNQIELNYTQTVLRSGYYKIRILNYGYCNLRLYIQITPSAWSVSKEGTGVAAWKIIK